jgi:hypothetical protein
VADFDWVVWEIVLQPQEIEDGDTAKDTDVVSEIDKDAAVSETPELRAPDLDCSARSKPWRPMPLGARNHSHGPPCPGGGISLYENFHWT